MTKSDSKIGLHNNQSDVDDEDDVNNNSNSNNETKQNKTKPIANPLAHTDW